MQGKETSITIKANGKTKTVHTQQVLIVKPKTDHVDKAKLAAAALDIEGALRTIPVKDVRETKKGALLVKLPTAEAKKDAGEAMNAIFGDSSEFTVSEPNKTLPKMTIVGIPLTCPDNEILSSILEKNKDIRNLKQKGCTLEFLFAKPASESKTAVIKMSPEIRTSIERDSSRVYVGLSRCRAYDRFWVTQCYHCQKFGHIASKCQKKG